MWTTLQQPQATLDNHIPRCHLQGQIMAKPKQAGGHEVSSRTRSSSRTYIVGTNDLYQHCQPRQGCRIFGEMIAFAQTVLTYMLHTPYHALVASCTFVYHNVHVHLQTPSYYVGCGYRESREQGSTSYLHLPQRRMRLIHVAICMSHIPSVGQVWIAGWSHAPLSPCTHT